MPRSATEQATEQSSEQAAEQAARLDHARLHDHWHQLDGWNRHRALLACYLTFEGEHELHELAQAYQDPLEDLPQLDRIAPSWLHATVQGIAFADELRAGTARLMSARLGEALRDVRPLRLVTGLPVASSTGLYLPIGPSAGVAALRDVVRGVSRDVLGADLHDLPGQGPDGVFDPHVSFAYANDTIDVDPIWDRLMTVTHPAVEFEVHSLSMVMLHRDDQDRRWHWSELTHLEFGR